MNRDVLELINQAVRKEWPRLYLDNRQLTELPPEIGQLTKLQELGLSKNQLTALPPEIGQLAQLRKLDLSVNQLSSLIKSYRTKSHKVVPVKLLHSVISRQAFGVKGSAS